MHISQKVFIKWTKCFFSAIDIRQVQYSVKFGADHLLELLVKSLLVCKSDRSYWRRMFQIGARALGVCWQKRKRESVSVFDWGREKLEESLEICGCVSLTRTSIWRTNQRKESWCFFLAASFVCGFRFYLSCLAQTLKRSLARERIFDLMSLSVLIPGIVLGWFFLAFFNMLNSQFKT